MRILEKLKFYILCLRSFYLSHKTYFQCLKAVEEDLKNFKNPVDYDEQLRIFDSWEKGEKKEKLSHVYGGLSRKMLDI